MSWISYKRTNQKHKHRCQLPVVPKGVDVGAVWQCDDCNKRYRLTLICDGSWLALDIFGQITGPDGSNWAKTHRWAR